MQVDSDTRLPDGIEDGASVLSRADERALARESTAAFAGEYIIILSRGVLTT